MSTRLFPSILFCVLLLAGCAPITQNQMVAKGGVPLTAKQIFDLVSGNTLHMESIDINAQMYFQPDGIISARAEAITADDTDKGDWDINGENQLCLKFKVWYYGEMRCYSVYSDAGKNAYALFRDNGALAYSAKSSTGDSARLYKTPKPSQKGTYLRESLTTGQPSPSAMPAAQPTQQSAEASNTTSFLRESLAAEQAIVSQPESGAPAVSGQRDEVMPVAADEEVEHSVKSMAKNCPGCNLAKSDLRQADLVGANLQGANLKGADLSRANLRRANLEGANLSGAILVNTNLPGANLKDANLTAADLSGANLIKADFTGAKTENMILTNALIEGVKGLE